MSRKKKIAGMLQRYNFTDFAIVVSLPRAVRKDHLRTYIDRPTSGRWSSYKGLRSMVADIVGVERRLDLTGPMSFEEIERGLKLHCHPDDLGFNTEAARTLFDFVRPIPQQCYNDHPRHSLRIGPDRLITMGIEHYAVADGVGAFRYLYPRRQRLSPDIWNIMMSLVHHNYVQDNFEGFQVQIIDLSCEDEIGPRGGIRQAEHRSPRIFGMNSDDLISRDDLNAEADNIYRLLLEIEKET